MKRKLFSIIIVFCAIASGVIIMNNILKQKYYYKVNSQSIIGQDQATDNIIVPYYYTFGEYPLDVLPGTVDYNYEDTLTNKLYVQNIWMTDSFSKDGQGQLKYYPLYNRKTGKRESFIVLSAGIDGKIDNIFTAKDTLYIDSWWEMVKLYNLDDMLVYKYINDHYANISTVIEREGKDSIDYEILNFYDPSKKYSDFALRNYFFGKKDLIIQLDTLPYRNTQ